MWERAAAAALNPAPDRADGSRMEALPDRISGGVRPRAAGAARTALIVHGDRHVRSYLRMLLGQIGVVTVGEAATHEELADAYTAARPSVVLVDIDQPGLDVDELCAPLRARDPEAAVIAITARPETEFHASLQQGDLLDYILIHVVREEISRRLSAAMDLLAARAQAPERLSA